MILEPLDVEKARLLSSEKKISIFEALACILQVDVDKVSTILSQSFSFPILSFDEILSAQPSFDILSFSDCQKRSCVLQNSNGVSRFVLTNPFQAQIISMARYFVTGDNIFLCNSQDMQAYLSWCESEARAIHVLPDADSGPEEEHETIDLSLASVTEDQNIVVKIVNTVLYDALKSRASDIHLETNESGIHIKYRIDGLLVAISQINGQQTAEQIIARLKVLAILDTSERRIPQDGAFKAKINRRSVDFRVSIIPSIFGEDAVIRVLDKQSLSGDRQYLTFDLLGLEQGIVAQIQRMLSLPHGLFLVTGPTGSGKTTTLYACLTHLNSGDLKIISIEDPVEYHISNILQILVNHRQGLTFERGLRSVLRHDPDIIMVGEIRDSETAQISIQAALTGHLVLTTVHANNVFDVIGRFLHMGADAYSLVTALNGVLAQRLVRRLCDSCREPLPISESQISFLNHKFNGKFLSTSLWKAVGCSACRGTGYSGRCGIAELLVLDDSLRDLIICRAPISELKEKAMHSGFTTMTKGTFDLLAEGKTSFEEIQRVIG